MQHTEFNLNKALDKLSSLKQSALRAAHVFHLFAVFNNICFIYRKMARGVGG